MPVGMSSLGIARTIFTNSGATSGSVTYHNMNGNANYSIIPACESVDLFLNVTANTGTNQSVTGAWVELQTSVDGGTTWATFWRSTQLTSSTTTQRDCIRTNGIGANEAAVSTVAINTATGAVKQNCVITADQRVVVTQATTNGNSGAITFGLYEIIQQSGTRASY